MLGIEDDYREEQLDKLMNHAGDPMETDIPHSRMWGAYESQLKSKGYFKAVDLKTVLSVAKGRSMPNSGTELRAVSTGNVKWVKTKLNFGDPRTMPYLKKTIKVIQNCIWLLVCDLCPNWFILERFHVHFWTTMENNLKSRQLIGQREFTVAEIQQSYEKHMKFWEESHKRIVMKKAGPDEPQTFEEIILKCTPE